jgi:hypothetical protein
MKNPYPHRWPRLKRLFQKPFRWPSRDDFLCSGAHVLKYAPLWCSETTAIRLDRTAFETVSKAGVKKNFGFLPEADGGRVRLGRIPPVSHAV